MRKNLGKILITGGAGFIGSNLIHQISLNYKFNKIISIDNYYTGKKVNHIKHKKIKYLNLDTKNILNSKNKILKNFKPRIVFHFAEFSRIVPSFKHITKCWDSNINGTYNVIQYCIKNNSRLIYSGSSSKFGKIDNEHLSPYSWTKSKNIELIKNFSSWFKLNFTIVYFYNVYGSNQIQDHFMSAVIGIFESQYKKKSPLTVVKPGNQKRDFTHVNDIVRGTILAALKGKKTEYQLGSGKNYKLIDVAKMFKTKIKMISERSGERFSSLSDYSKAKKELGYIPICNLEKYIKDFLILHKKS